MRRMVLSFLAAAVLVSTTGCIAASVRNNRFAGDRGIVAVKDRVYVIDTSTGKVQEIDLSAAEPFVPEPPEEEE